jgi:serine/threonine protein kinase
VVVFGGRRWGVAKQRENPFEILEVLGEGSFGTVCVARLRTDPLQQKVALKILKGAYTSNKKILNRTRDEARLLYKLRHPNIVRVHKLIEVNGWPVVVMEYVEGASLDQLLVRYKDGLPGAVALEITRLMCGALHFAYAEARDDRVHTAGVDERETLLRVIHRDIKPSNVLISVNGEVKIADFGIAKSEFGEREAQTESVVMGSRPYMAPERLDGMNDSPSVDVFSVGMSLMELLTGRTMSLSINPKAHDEAMSKQLGRISVAGMAQQAQEDLRDLVRRMCAYSRDYRPTAQECFKELGQLLFAIEPRYRIGLEEFAKTTVVPIYESRARTAPDSAELFRQTADDDYRDITEAVPKPAERMGDGGLVPPASLVPSAAPSPAAAQNRRGRPPYATLAFGGAVVAVIAALAVAVAVKAMSTRDGGEAAGSGAKIKVWLPSDASAEVGGVVLPRTGHVLVQPGPSELKLLFMSGQVLLCPFEARDGAAVRFSVDAGRSGITVDDGDVLPCTALR